MLGDGGLAVPEDPGDRIPAQAPEVVELEAFPLAGGEVLLHRPADLPQPGGERGLPSLPGLLALNARIILLPVFRVAQGAGRDQATAKAALTGLTRRSKSA